jgi:hypothetical protein
VVEGGHVLYRSEELRAEGTITADSLDERLPVDDRRDEFGRLATVFNETLGRLQGSFDRLRRFTADASHELRTPLTAMRSVGEVALHGSLDPPAYRDVIGSMLEEVQRLTALVENLLLLTRADSGALRPASAIVDVGQVATRAADAVRVLAEEKEQTLTIQAQGVVEARCDPALLRHGIVNLRGRSAPAGWGWGSRSRAGPSKRTAAASSSRARKAEAASSALCSRARDLRALHFPLRTCHIRAPRSCNEWEVSKMKRVLFMMAALAGCATGSSSSSQPQSTRFSSGAETFQARMDARSEVPPPNLDSSASPTGNAMFTVNGTTVAYKINASGLSGPPTAAHIHTGEPGVAGPVLVPLTVTAGSSPGTATGEGTFDASAVKAKKSDGSAMTMDDVLSAMRNGETYVNIHTANNKPGEIRGQIQK